MMDAVKFMDEYKRMCAYYEDCEQCPARILSDCGVQVQEQLLKIVERWAAEHPKKTRLSEFLRLFPNAHMTGENFPYGCCKMYDYTAGCKDWKDCEECRCVFWNAEV